MSNRVQQEPKMETPSIGSEMAMARSKLDEARERLESLMGAIVGGGEAQDRRPEPPCLIDMAIDINATAGDILTLAARLSETLL